LKRVGSLSPFKFLFLVKGITTIWLMLMNRFVLSHYHVCKASDTI
jgi:hypothetical protein